MAVIKCKMCGGELNITEGESVAECEYCGSRQTVPVIDDEKKLTLFARANRLRLACEFDKASGIYESIVAEFPEEAEAYWGLVLCKYGIEYVDDPATGKKIPTCHRSSFDSVMEDRDFEQACENADGIARKLYRQEAKQIEELRKGILEVSGKEEPYDIFICYKETDENGDRTLDSVLAQDIYDTLTDKGYRVFFSRITLEDKLGQEYEPYIFAALNSAKIMLAVGTDYEYYNAVWVKNEWSRYLKLMAKDKDKHLIPCYKNLDAYDMPKEFVRLQAQDLGKVGAMQDLLRGISKVLDNHNTISKSTAAAPVNAPDIQSLLERATLFLENGQWNNADSHFNHVLDMDFSNGRAHVGKFLAEFQLHSINEICKLKQRENRAYQIIQIIMKGKTADAYALLAKNMEGDEALNYIKTIDADPEKAYFMDISNSINYKNAVRFSKNQTDFWEEIEKLKDEMHIFLKSYRKSGIEGLETLYTEAHMLMNNSQFKDAALKFDEIGSYKDAPKLAKKCKELQEHKSDRKFLRDFYIVIAIVLFFVLLFIKIIR